MDCFKRERTGKYTVVCRGSQVDVLTLVEKAHNPELSGTGGRGVHGIFPFEGQTVVCRQYLHGGWLRGLTRGAFLSEKRASGELEITEFLREKGFPVVSPFGFIVEKGLFAKKLYFLSVFLDDAHDFIERFRSANAKRRLRLSKKLSFWLFTMGQLGVYHPDMHLRNVLVTGGGEFFFLDFDRACRKKITHDDYEKMFWRLDRFVRKYSFFFGETINETEKLIFLRTYERLSGRKIVEPMREKLRMKKLFGRAGWCIDKILYGGKK